MALQVIGKTALVTGGGSGLCLEFTKGLLSNGCNVVIADLRLRPEAQAVVDAKGGSARARFIETDVTNWAQLQKAFDFALKEFGSLDIVCPGAGLFEPVSSRHEEDWEKQRLIIRQPSSNFWQFNVGDDTPAASTFKTIEINVTHPIRATQLAIDYFKRQKHGHGVVLNISSIAGQLALLPIPLYCSSKAAISSFTRSLAMLEPMENIRVVGVAPGIVNTPIWTQEKREMVDESVDEWVPMEKVIATMLDLVQKPEHVGGTILEVGYDLVRAVNGLNDPGPSGKGHAVSNIAGAFAKVPEAVAQHFGK